MSCCSCLEPAPCTGRDRGLPAGRRGFGALRGRARGWGSPGPVLRWQGGAGACEGRQGERRRASEHCALGTRLLSPTAAADQVIGLEPPARAPRRLRAPAGHGSPLAPPGLGPCSRLGQARAAGRSLRAGLLPGDLLLQSSGVRGVKLHAEAHGEGGLGCREKSDAAVTTRQGLSPPSPRTTPLEEPGRYRGPPENQKGPFFFLGDVLGINPRGAENGNASETKGVRTACPGRRSQPHSPLICFTTDLVNSSQC